MALGFMHKEDRVIRIVLADDQIEVRRSLERYLARDGGFELVGQAEDGEQAIEIVSGTQPDVLITDLAMPNMNGLQAVAAIRETSASTKIVVLSSVAPFFGARTQALEAGADAVFDKYTNPKVLIKTIKTLIEPAGQASGI